MALHVLIPVYGLNWSRLDALTAGLLIHQPVIGHPHQNLYHSLNCYYFWPNLCITWAWQTWRSCHICI